MLEITLEILVPASSGMLCCHGQGVHSICLFSHSTARNLFLLFMRASFMLQALQDIRLYVDGLRNLAANWFYLICRFLLMGAGFHIAKWDKKMLF